MSELGTQERHLLQKLLERKRQRFLESDQLFFSNIIGMLHDARKSDLFPNSDHVLLAHANKLRSCYACGVLEPCLHLHGELLDVKAVGGNLNCISRWSIKQASIAGTNRSSLGA